MAASRDLRRRAVEAARRYGLPEVGGEITAWSALWEALVGEPSAAGELATEALDHVRSRDTLRLSALALALSGRREEAEALLAELYDRYPRNTWVRELYGPTVEAALALEAGDPEAAVRVLERAEPWDDASLETLYLRARALDEAGDEAAAREELRAILDRPGVLPASPIRTLAERG